MAQRLAAILVVLFGLCVRLQGAGMTRRQERRLRQHYRLNQEPEFVHLQVYDEPPTRQHRRLTTLEKGRHGYYYEDTGGYYDDYYYDDEDTSYGPPSPRRRKRRAKNTTRSRSGSGLSSSSSSSSSSSGSYPSSWTTSETSEESSDRRRRRNHGVTNCGYKHRHRKHRHHRHYCSDGKRHYHCKCGEAVAPRIRRQDYDYYRSYYPDEEAYSRGGGRDDGFGTEGSFRQRRDTTNRAAPVGVPLRRTVLPAHLRTMEEEYRRQNPDVNIRQNLSHLVRH